MSTQTKTPDQTHRRLNPLTNEWVLVSPHRALRPWQGQTEAPPQSHIPSYDPSCYLCPGNKRNSGKTNARYTGTFVFTNDTPALLPQEKKSVSSLQKKNTNELFVEEPVFGTCEVVCYSPDHGKTMATMTEKEIDAVITTWQERYKKLGSNKETVYVQIFENKGAMMGCSQPHPHNQIWTMSVIPNEPAKELAAQKVYEQNHHSLLLLDYVKQELQKKERILFTNDSFVVLVPYWAIWPFQTMIVPRTQVSAINDLSKKQISHLSNALSMLTKTYDGLFGVSFPYSMGIHQAPTDGKRHDYQTMHMEFYPPLLRSATVKTHMVGYELIAMPQRDITAEKAAAKLREVLQTIV